MATGLAATLAVSSVLSSSAVRQNTAALAAGGQQPNIVCNRTGLLPLPQLLDDRAEPGAHRHHQRGESAGRGTQDRNPYLAAMLKHVDDGVGMIDQKLKELGMYDNTILVIASDNGGDLAVTDNGELRGGKTDLYEGGIRDPLLIRWPEKMQGGQETDFPTHMIDFYQTFGEAAGLPPEEIPENSGISLMPLLSGAGVPDRDTLYWVMLRDTTLTPGFTVDYDTIFREGGAIRKGDYKYLESFAHDRRELYNLAEDPGEHNNLIDRYPEIAQALSRELHSLFERDTYGKTFQTGFEGDEYYRWSNSGAFTYANGSFSSSGASGGAVALQMYLYYDAKVQVDVTAPETGRAGLQFRSSLAKPTNPAFKAYAAVLDAEKGRVELLNVKGQNASVLAAADLELTPGAQYRLRVETDSDQIQIYVDDELALTCFDQTYLKGGIGLYADGAVTTFDNLTATGVEGMRPVSDRQLGFAPPHDIKVKADGSYIWPDVEPVRQEEEILFDAEAFLTALGGQVDFDPVTGTSTTRFQGLEASYTLGSTQAIAGGETVTLAAAPTVIAGRIHVPLSFLLEALRLDYTAEGDTVDCSSSLETEIRHTETDKITYTGAWITGGEAGDATRSKVKGETAELAFQGTGVRLYVSNGTGAGLCNIYIDDQLADTVDTYSPTTGSDVLAFQKTGLPDGSHTIRVENAGPGQSGSSANLNIHRFVVVKRDPILVNSSEEILYSRTDRIQYTGGWYTGGDAGDCMRSKQAGDTAELSFQGTGIRLYGSNGPGAGIFQVSIDDQPAERVDTYSASSHNDVLFYEIDNLPAGSHTLRVENTGEKNPAGTATNINIRRFVTVNQPAEESKTEEIRYNDQQGRIAYSAGWTIGGAAGAAARSTKAGETAELAFQGTGIEVYVNNGTGAGKLHIYIDDVLTDTVDTYSDKSSSNVLAFSKTDLARGSHVLRLENAGPGQSGKSANINLHRLVVMDNPGAEPSFTPGEVSDRIAALPESLGDTLDSRPAIRAAAAALASLPAEQQAQVDGREKLTALSEAAAAFEAPPAAINLLLGSLPAPVQVTRAQQDDIAALQADYTALNPEQKLLVVQAKKLTRLQAALDSLLEQTGALQALYDSYADMAQGDYTDTSWAELQAALLEAGAVLASDTATLADADATITRLSQAAEGLEIQTPQPDGRLEAALKAAGAAVNALAVSNKTTGDDVLTAAREAVDDDIQITCLAVL